MYVLLHTNYCKLHQYKNRSEHKLHKIRAHNKNIKTYKNDDVEGKEDVSDELCLPFFVFVHVALKTPARPLGHQVSVVLHCAVESGSVDEGGGWKG